MKSIILLFLALATFWSKAQDQSLYLEILGQSGYYSVNYEKVFDEGVKNKSFYRIGFGYIPGRANVVVPMELGTYFPKDRNHHLDISTSLLFATEDNRIEMINGRREFGGGKSLTVIWMNRIGYRFQKPEGRFLFRIGFTPVNARINFKKDDYFFAFHPYGGISIGYVIKNRI